MSQARRRVFFVGASGVGKSTLAALMAREMGLPFLTISPSAVYARHGYTIAECFEDRGKMAAVQYEVADYTATCLEREVNSPGYVTDRAFDLSIYGALLGVPHPEPKVLRVLRAMTDGEYPVHTSIVFVRPSARVLTAARLADKGRRGQFLSDPWVYRVDGALEYFIRTRRMECVEIPGDMAELTARAEFLRDKLGIAPHRPEPAHSHAAAG